MALLKLKDTGDPETIRRHLRKLLNAFDWLVQMELDIGDSMYKRMMLKMTKCVRGRDWVRFGSEEVGTLQQHAVTGAWHDGTFAHYHHTGARGATWTGARRGRRGRRTGSSTRTPTSTYACLLVTAPPHARLGSLPSLGEHLPPSLPK